MAKEGQSGLEAITGALSRAAKGLQGLPPVELWNPPFCGDIDMRIAADGTWFYMKTPVGRPALVKLFASVLKREGDNYFLVTPVEKCGIRVDDAPFLAVEMTIEEGAQHNAGSSAGPDARPESRSGARLGAQTGAQGGASGRVLNFRTNVDDWVACGPEHPLRFEPERDTGGLKPYLHVRRDLWAKVTRALFFDLVELGEEREIDGVAMFGISSTGVFFPMAPADQLKEFM